MAAAVAIIIAALAILAIVYPFVRRSGIQANAPEPGPSHLQQLLDQRESLVNSLRELEADRGLGKMPEAEYRTLREDYERQAIAVLITLDSRANGLAAEIEEEVTALRLHRSAETPRETAASQCPQCGAPRDRDPPDAACPRCGFRDQPEAR